MKPAACPFRHEGRRAAARNNGGWAFRGGCGAGGSGRQVEQQTGFDKLATQHGFVAVNSDASALPGGPGLRTWNAGHCCGLAPARDGQDVSGIDATPIVWAFLSPYALSG